MFVSLSWLISETTGPILNILSKPYSVKFDYGFRRKFETINLIIFKNNALKRFMKFVF